MKGRTILFGVIFLTLGSMVFGLFFDKKIDVIKLSHIEENMMTLFILETAKDRGIFEKHDLEVESFPVILGLNEPFVTGKTDVTIGPTIMVGNYMNGANMKIIGNIGQAPDYLISRFPTEEMDKIKKVGVRGIPSNDELKIRSFWSSLGQNADLLDFIILEEKGDKIRLLRQSEIDASILLYGPAVDVLIEEGFYLIEDNTESYPEMYIFVLEEKMNDRPDVFERFVVAIYEAMESFKNNEDDSIEMIKRLMMIDEPEAKTVYTDFMKNLGKTNYVPSSEKIKILRSSIIETIGNSLSHPERDLEDIIEVRPAEKAIKMLGI